VVKRLASHPEYRRLIENYKRNSLPSRVGYISNKHFLSSLRAIEFPLKKAEFNLLLKEFRAIGLPDTFHFQRMVDLAHGLPWGEGGLGRGGEEEFFSNEWRAGSRRSWAVPS
jgi:hypothetical protein